jgi:hypothetical protein
MKSKRQAKIFLARALIGNHRNLDNTMAMSTGPSHQLPKDYFPKIE